MNIHAEGSESPAPSSLARILDANANRAAEGLRVVEDYLRFCLEDCILAECSKRLRHDLCVIFEQLPNIWTSRDAAGDVGRVISAIGERRRVSEQQVVLANLKRAQQACRSLEEWVKSISEGLALEIEQIRYRSYDLETAVRRSWQSRQRLASCQLYVLADGTNSQAEFEQRVSELIGAGVDLIQLRDKSLDDGELWSRAKALRGLTSGTETMFIMNDRADIAAAAQADGVHLGQDDLPIASVRRVVGPHRLIGRSTHSIEQVHHAVQEGADYLGVGPVFPSQTKSFKQFPGLEFASTAVRVSPLPAFAIGGICASNVQQLIELGVRRVATSHAVWRASDIKTACRDLLGPLRSATAALIITWAILYPAANLNGQPNDSPASSTETNALPFQRGWPKLPHSRLECLCELEKDNIVESSGLAASRRVSGMLWTHNDSGDKPRLFAFDLRGRHRGTCYLIGADAEDWEDMGAFTWRQQHYLFVADVGDNQRKRSTYTLYIAVEPTSPKDDASARPIHFRYEDGAHDCEAVAFDPTSKSFLLVEKVFAFRSRVYQLPWPVGGDTKLTSTARLIGDIPAPVVTAADISPDGLQMAIATYRDGLLIDRKPEEAWEDALQHSVRLPLPTRRQGETVCYSADGTTLYLTSEKKPCPLFAIPVQIALPSTP